MAIYIDKHFRAHQHIVYQPDVTSIEVEYVSREFDLAVPQAAFEFIFQIYNFFSGAKEDNNRLSQPDIQLTRAKESVEEKNYPTFPKRKQEAHNEKRSAKKSKRNPDTSAQGGQEDTFDNPSFQREVTGAGYTPTQPIPEEFTPLTPIRAAAQDIWSQKRFIEA